MLDGEDGTDRAGRLNRRELIRRGAIVGGTLLWATPAIQSLAPNAYAQQRAGSFRACCQCSGKHGGAGSCSMDAITYVECGERCGGRSRVAYYGIGNFSCVDGSCVETTPEGGRSASARSRASNH